MNNEYACNLLDRSYINNYKKVFIRKLSNNQNLIKGGEILEKLLNEILKRKAVEIMKKKLQVNTFIKKMNNTLIKKIKEKFMYKFDELVKANEEKEENKDSIKLNKFGKKIKSIMNNNLKKYVLNKLKENFQLYKNIEKLKKGLEKIIKKIFFEKLKNKLDKINEIKSRYSLSNITGLSTIIEKLLLKKTKKNFINELEKIKKIDEQLFHTFWAISHNIKKRGFDCLKTIYFVDILNNTITNINKINGEELKKEFIDKLKDIYKNYLKEKNDKKVVNEHFNRWNESTNKEKIFNLLKNNLKLRNKEFLKKYFGDWKNNSDKAKIFSDLKNWKKERVKEKDNNMLKKSINKLNDKSIRRKILDKLRKLSKLKNCFKILKEKDNKNIEKFFNNWKNKSKLLKEKENKIYIPKNIKLKKQKVESTLIRSQKPKKPEYVIIKQNNIFINDKKNRKNNRDNIFIIKEKNEKSIKKRKKKSKSKSKSKSSSKIKKYQKEREILEDGFEKWRDIIKKMKSKDDLKDVIDSIKNYGNQNLEDKDNSSEEILQKIKKASLYLILDIYKKNKNILMKKYFDIWVKNAKENNNEKKESFASKYIKKKIGLFNKINEIRNNNNKIRLRTNFDENEKTFTKRKTKVNFYKDTIDQYNSLGDKLLSNLNPIEDYFRANTERSYNNNNLLSSNTPSTLNYLIKKNNLDRNYLTEEKRGNNPKRIYTSRSMEKRKPKRELTYSIFGEDNENEYPSGKMNNYDNKMETADNKYILYLKNLDNTFSSINYSTNNHFSLIEESNEVRKPDDYNDPKLKKNKIKDLLSTPFEKINNTSYLNNILLTETKSRNERNKDFRNYDQDMNFTSKSQKTRSRIKPKMFTVSIPINKNYNYNEEDDNNNLEYNTIENVKKQLKYNDLKRNKEISPEKGYNNYYSIDERNTNAKTNRNNNINYSQYFSTPFKDFRIDWEDGNSTCPRIIMGDDNNQSKNDNSGLNNDYRSNNKNKRIKHNKCKSAFEYKPELGKTYLNNKNRYNFGNKYFGKKLFY